MALNRAQIEPIPAWVVNKNKPWKRFSKDSTRRKLMKKAIHKLLRRMSIDDTPTGKTNKKPTYNWEY